MNGYLHVIGNKSNREYLEKQIILFSDYCYAESIRITENAYWKDERCIEFSAELKFKQYDYESVIKSVTHFWGKEEDIICIEQQENIEAEITHHFKKTKN